MLSILALSRLFWSLEYCESGRGRGILPDAFRLGELDSTSPPGTRLSFESYLRGLPEYTSQGVCGDSEGLRGALALL